MQKDTLTMEEKICPYLDVDCQTVCPAWLDDMEDCLFHISETQVRAVFYQAVAYLDQVLGIEGYDTLKQIRDFIKSGQGVENMKPIVVVVINKLLATGVARKTKDLGISDLASIFSSVEKVIGFDLASLFWRPTEDAESEEGEEEPLVFAE